MMELRLRAEYEAPTVGPAAQGLPRWRQDPGTVSIEAYTVSQGWAHLISIKADHAPGAQPHAEEEVVVSSLGQFLYQLSELADREDALSGLVDRLQR